MRSELKYALRIWITALLIAPLLIFIWMTLDDYGPRTTGDLIEDFFIIVTLLIGLGGLYSIPSVFILWLASFFLRGMSPLKRKAILSFIGIVLSVLPFMLMAGGPSLAEGRVFVWFYAVIIIASIWIYKLPNYTQHNDLTE